MQHKSGRLFQRSNVVHLVSVQSQEVHCFIASADKKIIVPVFMAHFPTGLTELPGQQFHSVHWMMVQIWLKPRI